MIVRQWRLGLSIGRDDSTGHQISSFAFCAGLSVFALWCPVPVVRGVHKCLNSVIGPYQVRGYGLKNINGLRF
jgi:hypothetical protein